MRLHTVLLLITFLLSIVVKANYQDYYHGNFNKKDSLWVDSVFNTMNDLEKIGQLFTVRINSNANKSEIEEITRLIKTYNIGGLVFFKGTPYKEARLTNYFQSITKVPLLISIDGEWGLGMRLDSTISFPKQMTLGAIENDSLIYDIGKEVAREFRRLGIHQNFAPVLDINNNPLNPVINIRSFGESKYKVAQKGIAFMKGMEDNGLQTIAKHFPGHGNTICDSHKELPLINVSCTELDTMELYPFKEIIKNNIKGIMVGHLSVPALDSTKELASTLSYKIVTETLKNKLGFKGLIYTDALDMGAITKFFRKGEAEVKALKAGNDILLLSENVPQAVNAITYAIDSCSLDPDLISQKCKKILFTKKLVGIDHICPVDMNNLEKDLNSKEAELLNIKSYENALTLLQNKNNIIPLKRLDTLKIAAISIGDINPDIFQKSLY
ncbi:MAG: glycoside hydrolase family 3 N-terminal domain-containing protein [Bacteroidota bacterium]|nr:glycoside hydrolase family 3 N-terminal domain-containing protein [Bacteroidota bacterium]